MNFRPSTLKLRAARRERCALAVMFLTIATSTGFAQVVPPAIAAGVAKQETGKATTASNRATRPPASPSTPSLTQTQPNSSPRMGDTGIETLYVRDETGELVPILNLSYEDFVRLYQIDRGLDATKRAPSYSIESLAMTGKVRGNRAELELTFQIKISGDETTQVPLRLNGAILREPAKYEGGGKLVLTAAGPDGGYICWLKGAPDSVHKTTVKLIAPVVRVGNASRVSLSLPTATASNFQFTIPAKDITATVSSTARIVSQKTTPAATTLVSVAGAKGDFQIGWTDTAATVTQSPLLLEAASTIQVRVKGPGAVSTLARIRVSSSGRAMDSVRIRLPADCKPVAVEDPRYTTEFVTPSEPTATERKPATEEPNQKTTGKTAAIAASKTSAARPIAVIKFTEPTMGPVDIQLAVEQSRSSEPAEKKRKPFDVLGFEVIDALRHFGTVSLIAEGDWLVRTQPSADLRRLGDIPDAIAQDGLVAAFDFYQQPASLPIRVLAKETRLNVDPTYLLDVQSNEVELTAILDCQVLGAPAFALSMDMSGWDVLEVGQANLVQQDGLRLSEVAPLEIPLATAMRGDFQIRVRARRPIPPATQTLEIRLPVVRDASASPAVVVVNPADNLTISARPGLDTNGSLFDPEPLPSGLAIPTRSRTPFCYQYRGDPASATLVYDFGRREQSVTVSVANNIRINKSGTQVEQRLTYNVLYQPLTAATLLVPNGLKVEAGGDNDSLRIFLDGEELPFDDITIALDENSAETGDEIWTIPMRSPRLGKFELDVRYKLPWSLDDSASVETTLPNTIPFPRPTSAEPDGTTIQVGCAKQFAITLSEYAPWAVEESRSPWSDSLSLVEYQGTTCPRTIALEVRALEGQRTQAGVIDELFAQTWLTETQRQDRVAATLSGATFPLRIGLPPGALSGNVKVLVDGSPASVQLENEDILIVNAPASTLPTHANTRIELVYRFDGRPSTGNMEFALPRFLGATWVQHFYWQVVMPENEHLLTHGKEVTGDHIWKRQGFVWHRTPRVSQAQLQTLVGATTQTEPGISNNQYLFTGFGESPRLMLQTASRRWLLLVSSGFILGLALLSQILPWIAGRWTLLALTLIFSGSAWLYPAPAIVVAQAAVIGVGVAIMARLLDWMLKYRRASAPVYESRPQTHSGRSATLVRGSSIAQPHSTDALSVPAASRR